MRFSSGTNPTPWMINTQKQVCCTVRFREFFFFCDYSVIEQGTSGMPTKKTEVKIPPQVTCTEMDLSMRSLASVPHEITLDTSLRVLKLNWNKLGTLPKEMGHLTTLQELCCNGNVLHTLPT